MRQAPTASGVEREENFGHAALVSLTPAAGQLETRRPAAGGAGRYYQDGGCRQPTRFMASRPAG